MTGGAALYAAFDELRRRDPGALALHDADRGRVLDRDALARLVEEAARALRGVAPGARIGLQVPNSPELVAAVFACWREGLVPVPLDRELAPVEVAGIRARLGLAAVRAGAELGEPALPAPVQADPVAAEREPRASGAAAEAPAVVKLTSGSTGAPRGVAVSAAALCAGGRQILATMDIRPEDRNLVTIPLAHSYGFDNVVVALALTGTAAVLTADLTPPHLLRIARESGATVFPSVPFLLDLLARSSARAELPALRLVISAGAPLPRETRERFYACFGLRPRTFYGSTECGGITFDRTGTDLPDGCVGTPLDGVAIELAEADDGAGRVVVRSASVATGYVPACGLEDEAALGGGRFVTADVGRLDEAGRLHLLGRALDVINVGGRKVYPAEVERVIRTVPGVRDAVVLAAERSAVAAAVRAVVEAASDVTRADVVAACRAALARYKVPRRIELVRELPRTARGKVDRRRLADERSSPVTSSRDPRRGA